MVVSTVRVINTMDSTSFENIKSAVQGRNFKDENLDALKSTLSCSYGYLSAEQVAQLSSEFSFDDDKEKAVEVCVPRMYSITCEQAKSILSIFSFDKSKIKVLEAIACHITDNNLGALDEAFDFPSDRERAKEILMNRPRSGMQPGFPPQAGVYPGAGPPPGGFPGMVPQPGGYPAPAPYQGQSPYPGQSPFPGAYGGMCPPGQYPYGQPGPGAVYAQYPPGTVPPQYQPPGGYYPYQSGGAGQ